MKTQVIRRASLVVLLTVFGALLLSFQNCAQTPSVDASNATAATGTTATVASSAGSLAITSQPTSFSAAIGGFGYLSVTVSDTLAVTYQWYQGGVAIAGATNATLYIPTLTSANFTSYFVVISDGTNVLQSSTASITQTSTSSTTSTSTTSNDIGNCSYNLNGVNFAAMPMQGLNNVSTTDRTGSQTYSALNFFQQNWYRVAECLMAKTQFGTVSGSITVNTNSCMVNAAAHGYNASIPGVPVITYQDSWSLSVTCDGVSNSYTWHSCQTAYNSSTQTFTDASYRVSCWAVGY